MVQISGRKKTKKMIIVSESRVFLIILFTKSISKICNLVTFNTIRYNR
jgi:hypothetical protein